MCSINSLLPIIIVETIEIMSRIWLKTLDLEYLLSTIIANERRLSKLLYCRAIHLNQTPTEAIKHINFLHSNNDIEEKMFCEWKSLQNI